MDFTVPIAIAAGAIATLAAIAVIALIVVKSINSFKKWTNNDNTSTGKFGETVSFKIETSRKQDKESIEKEQKISEELEEEQRTSQELGEKKQETSDEVDEKGQESYEELGKKEQEPHEELNQKAQDSQAPPPIPRAGWLSLLHFPDLSRTRSSSSGRCPSADGSGRSSGSRVSREAERAGSELGNCRLETPTRSRVTPAAEVAVRRPLPLRGCPTRCPRFKE
uniref:Uncharacterized protein n=1 Tax=Myotis myotis TaxID=51298 RepID=A0A7J7XHD9_MYOMY|nr:hypothetical protein mMyoMyo1_011669 [Myotis myotis]